ncbi:MAG: hypothetical protein Q9208_002881 [Pyrenodesmia sp. 3 TL-2023]
MKPTTLFPLLLSTLLYLAPLPTHAVTNPTDPFQLPIPSTPLTLLLSGWLHPHTPFRPFNLYHLFSNAQADIVSELLSSSPPPTAPLTPNLEWFGGVGARRLYLRFNHNPFESGLTWTDFARVLEEMRKAYGPYTDFAECRRISIVHAGKGEVASGDLVVRRVPEQ